MSNPGPYDAVMGGNSPPAKKTKKKKKSPGSNLREFLDELNPYVRRLFIHKSGKVSMASPGISFKVPMDVKYRYPYITFHEDGTYLLRVSHYWYDQDGNNMQTQWVDQGVTSELTITHLQTVCSLSLKEARGIWGATDRVKEYAQPNHYTQQVSDYFSERRAVSRGVPLTALVENRGASPNSAPTAASIIERKRKEAVESHVKKASSFMGDLFNV